MDKLINEVNKLDLFDDIIVWLSSPIYLYVFLVVTVSENTIRNADAQIFVIQ